VLEQDESEDDDATEDDADVEDASSFPFALSKNSGAGEEELTLTSSSLGSDGGELLVAVVAVTAYDFEQQLSSDMLVRPSSEFACRFMRSSN
jgi:hypothetical protein